MARSRDELLAMMRHLSHAENTPNRIVDHEGRRLQRRLNIVMGGRSRDRHATRPQPKFRHPGGWLRPRDARSLVTRKD